ncbi:unnamed protein product [Rotaria sp. Silwood2]|nr:unnamed protein product [Rotaria sp. Silwood2]CAF3042495.1 unnamed protein product [Rotaria sp. Silwood2]
MDFIRLEVSTCRILAIQKNQSTFNQSSIILIRFYANHYLLIAHTIKCDERNHKHLIFIILDRCFFISGNLSNVKKTMAPHDFVEIRLVCKADYLDPQLKIKLHEIKDKLREILHTGRRRFALKKVQPWNSVKVTLDIPKEAADRLHLLAIQGNVRLIELGILSVEIVGQSNAIVVNSNNNNNNNNASTTTNPTTTNSKDLSTSSSSSSTTATTTKIPIDSLESTVSPSSINNFSYDNKTDDHRHKRVKLENGSDQQNYSNLNNYSYKSSSTTVNLMQPPPIIGHPIGHYISQQQQNPQILHRQPSTSTNNYGRLTYPNSGKPPPPPPHPYQTSSPMDNNNTTLSNGIGNDIHNYHHHDSWSTYVDHSNNYKMKVNGVLSNHYYPQQQQLNLSDSSSSSSSNIYCTQQQTQYDMRRCETSLTQMTTSATNIQNSYDGSSTGLSS